MLLNLNLESVISLTVVELLIFYGSSLINNNNELSEILIIVNIQDSFRSLAV